MYVKLAPPRDVATEAARDVSLLERDLSSQKVTIGSTKRKKLEAHIKRTVEAWESGTSSMRQRLKELNNFMEGKGEPVNFPFGKDSSKIDVRLAGARARALRTAINRAIFSDPSKAYIAKLGPGGTKEQRNELNKVEGATCWYAEEETNFNAELKDTAIPIYRDSTSLLYGEIEKRVEHGCDFRTYATIEEFQQDYPDAETADVSEEEYDNIIKDLSEYQTELQVEYELDFVAANGPTFTLFPLAKFIWYPLFAKDLKVADLYGYHSTLSGNQFDVNAKYGLYDSEAVDEVRKKHGGHDNYDGWDANQDDIEGISGESDEAISYKIAKLVVLYDLDHDGIPERYLVTWEMDASKILRIQRYGIRRNIPCIVPFRFVRRSGRLLGDSLLADGWDLYKEINAIHRHRSNVRRLTDAPIFIIPEKLKETLDLGAEYGEIYPGMTIWVPDQLNKDKYPQQLQLYNLDRTNNSADEESMVVRYLDDFLGISEGQSGRESSADPNAPASKTAMLLQRQDARIEDYIDEFRRSIPDALDLLRALIYQNSGSKLSFVMRSKGEMSEQEIASSLLVNPNIRMALKGISPSTNPAEDMNKFIALCTIALKLQVPVQMKPGIVAELWNEIVSASRIEAPDRFQIEQQDPMLGAEGGMAGGQQEKMVQVIQALMTQGPGGGAQAPQMPAGPVAG